jgi:cyclophilin family peptidyl-prolyl cis-trans isomerase
VRRLILLTAAALALVVAGCGSGKKDTRSSGGGDGAGTSAASASAPAASTGGCTEAQDPAPKPDGGQQKPKGKLDPKQPYKLQVDTNCGSFTIELFQKQSPNATASLVALAKAKFFDGTKFHRIAPGFVIQGGDPTGSGTGGPGYTTIDKPASDASYTEGVVAMAKAASEPPGAAGSQFYVVTGQDAQLPPDYAIVGKVSGGDDVVQRIGQLGGPDEQPTQPVVIKSVRLLGA